MNTIIDIQDAYTLSQLLHTTLPPATHQVSVHFVANDEQELGTLVQVYLAGGAHEQIIEVTPPGDVYGRDFTIQNVAFIGPDGQDISQRYPKLFGNGRV